MLNAGIVHQYVETSERLERRRDHVGNRFGFRHVRWRITNLDSELGDDSGLGLGDIFWLAKTVEHDGRAGCCECAGNTEPDTAGRSRYESHATFQGLGGLFKEKRFLDIDDLVLSVLRYRG